MNNPLFKLNDKKLLILEVEKQMINSKENYDEVRIKAKNYLENFKTMNIKENANKFSMYTDGVTRNIEIELTSNKEPFFVYKTCHELGHALHYLNMDQDLNYILKKSFLLRKAKVFIVRICRRAR